MNKREVAEKIAKITKDDVDNISYLLASMSLSEYASLATAIDSNDISTIKKLYRNVLRDKKDIPDVNDVIQKYDELVDKLDHDTAVEKAAEYFGISVEEVNNMVDLSIDYDTEFDSDFDNEIKEAVTKIKSILNTGKPVEGTLISELNMFQRHKMLAGGSAMIDKHLANVMGLDTKEVMKRHAQLRGFKTAGDKEFGSTVDKMLDKVAEDELIKLYNKKNKNKKEESKEDKKKRLFKHTVDFLQHNDVEVDAHGEVETNIEPIEESVHKASETPTESFIKSLRKNIDTLGKKK